MCSKNQDHMSIRRRDSDEHGRTQMMLAQQHPFAISLLCSRRLLWLDTIPLDGKQELVRRPGDCNKISLSDKGGLLHAYFLSVRFAFQILFPSPSPTSVDSSSSTSPSSSFSSSSSRFLRSHRLPFPFWPSLASLACSDASCESRSFSFHSPASSGRNMAVSCRGSDSTSRSLSFCVAGSGAGGCEGPAACGVDWGIEGGGEIC